MTITSKGYDGSVNEVDWAYLNRGMGVPWCVYDAGDWKVTIGGTGTLPVTVAGGRAFGSGVMDVNSAPINANAGAIGSGTRWDTVVIARDWSGSGGTTTVAVRAGTSTKALSASLNTTPGVLEDQPIALIRVDSTHSAVQEVIDLRQQAGKIQTYATAAALALFPAPVGAWAYTQDTGHLWHGELVSGSPTWVDLYAVDWTALSLAGGGLLGPVDTAPVYRISQDGLVKLRGSIARVNGSPLVTAAGSTDALLATLPAGFRPASARRFAVPGGPRQFGRILIGGTGEIKLYADGAQIDGVYLDGIDFYAEQ